MSLPIPSLSHSLQPALTSDETSAISANSDNSLPVMKGRAGSSSGNDSAGADISSEPVEIDSHTEPIIFSFDTESSVRDADTRARLNMSIAILRHDLASVERLLKKYPEILHALNPVCCISVLGEAVLAGDISIVKTLLALDAPLTTTLLKTRSSVEKSSLKGGAQAHHDHIRVESSSVALYEIVSDVSSSRSATPPNQSECSPSMRRVLSLSWSAGTRLSQLEDDAASRSTSLAEGRNTEWPPVQLPISERDVSDSDSDIYREKAGSDAEDDAGSCSDSEETEKESSGLVGAFTKAVQTPSSDAEDSEPNDETTRSSTGTSQDSTSQKDTVNSSDSSSRPDEIDIDDLTNLGWWTSKYPFFDQALIVNQEGLIVNLGLECMWAIHVGRVDILDLLLEHAVQMKFPMKGGILRGICEVSSEESQLKVVRTLVDHGVFDMPPDLFMRKETHFIKKEIWTHKKKLFDLLLRNMLPAIGDREKHDLAAGLSETKNVSFLREVHAVAQACLSDGDLIKFNSFLMDASITDGWVDGMAVLFEAGVQAFPYGITIKSPVLRYIDHPEVIRLVLKHLTDPLDRQKLLDLALVRAARDPFYSRGSGKVIRLLDSGANLDLDLIGLVPNEEDTTHGDVISLAFHHKQFQFFVEVMPRLSDDYLTQNAWKWISIILPNRFCRVQSDDIEHPPVDCSDLVEIIQKVIEIKGASFSKAHLSDALITKSARNPKAIIDALTKMAVTSEGTMAPGREGYLDLLFDNDPLLNAAFFCYSQGVDSKLETEAMIIRPEMVNRPHACDLYRFREELLKSDIREHYQFKQSTNWLKETCAALYQLSSQYRQNSEGAADSSATNLPMIKALTAHRLGLSATLFELLLDEVRRFHPEPSSAISNGEGLPVDWERQILLHLNQRIPVVSDSIFECPHASWNVVEGMQIIISIQTENLLTLAAEFLATRRAEGSTVTSIAIGAGNVIAGGKSQSSSANETLGQ